jgi:hypothetical protein
MFISRALKVLAPGLLLLLGAADAAGAPQYTAKGELIPPADYRDWVYLTSGLDMSYSDAAMAGGGSTFDNVFVDPAAWRAFQKTGHWPDKTVILIEARAATSHGSINKHGQYQSGGALGLELHVRDDARFKGGWGFFGSDGKTPARMIPYEAGCYSCHQAHGATDTTFTQFYPTAKAVAVKLGTFHEPAE